MVKQHSTNSPSGHHFLVRHLTRVEIPIKAGCISVIAGSMNCFLLIKIHHVISCYIQWLVILNPVVSHTESCPNLVCSCLRRLTPAYLSSVLTSYCREIGWLNPEGCGEEWWECLYSEATGIFIAMVWSSPFCPRIALQSFVNHRILSGAWVTPPKKLRRLWSWSLVGWNKLKPPEIRWWYTHPKLHFVSHICPHFSNIVEVDRRQQREILILDLFQQILRHLWCACILTLGRDTKMEGYSWELKMTIYSEVSH